MSNPWLVDEIEDFWFLNCPECAFKTKIQNDFQKHAVGNHTLSTVLFSDDSDILKNLNEATIKEEIGTNSLSLKEENFNKFQHLNTKLEPEDCLRTDDPTLEEIMYPDLEEDGPDMSSSIISTKKSRINIQKVSKEHKRESKIQFKNLIVKQCTEELISPARLAKIHKIDRDTVKRWVKNSGKKLPTKYVLQIEGKSYTYPPIKPKTSELCHNNLSISTQSFPEEESEPSNDVDIQQESQEKKYFFCPKCEYKGSLQCYLDTHLKSHQDCNQCGQTFFGGHSKRDLATHLKKHEVKLMKLKNPKQFICQFCKVEFKSKFSMNRHENTCLKKKQQV